MGTVWEGVHETLGTRVAVKRIEVENLDDERARKRFENEARAAAKLQSKHVVEVYDYGVGPDGHPFIVMQYLAGEALDKRLLRLGRMSAAETARIVVQICRALSRAHSLGIIHRDLKPENVFLVRDDEDGSELVKVVDFGIAKVVGAPAEDSATNTGNVVGTPYYMSPEQARGHKGIDHRTDLWSVGVIAFRCMVGRLPFKGDAVGDVLVNLCTGPIPTPSELASNLPPGFDDWIFTSLSRLPSERWASAQEQGDALATVCGIGARVSPITSDIPLAGIEGAGDVALRATDRAPSGENDPTTPLLIGAMFRTPERTSLVSPELTHAGTALTKTPAARQRVPALLAGTGIALLLIALWIALTRSATAPHGDAAGPAPAAQQAHVPVGAAKVAPLPPVATVALPQPDPVAAVPASASAAPAGSITAGPRSAPASRPTTTRRGAAAPSSSSRSLEIRLER